MNILAIRGATTCENDAESIWLATKELVEQILVQNEIEESSVISITFSATRDLDAAYPAVSVRENFSFDDTPLFCVQEMYVQGSLPKCLRVIIQLNS